MNLKFVVFFVGDALVLCEHDATAIVFGAVVYEFCDFEFGNVARVVVFVFKEYGRFAVA